MNLVLHVSNRQIANEFAHTFSIDIHAVGVKAEVPSGSHVHPGGGEGEQKGSPNETPFRNYKTGNWEDALDAIERGDLPTINMSGKVTMESDEVGHLVVPECRYGHRVGSLYITSKKVWFEYQGGWANWPVKYIISSRLEKSGFVFDLSDRQDVARLSTGYPRRDRLIVSLIQKLISMLGPDPTQRKSGDAHETHSSSDSTGSQAAEGNANQQDAA